MDAAQGGHLEVARLLLERGAESNAADHVSLLLLAIFAVKRVLYAEAGGAKSRLFPGIVAIGAEQSRAVSVLGGS